MVDEVIEIDLNDKIWSGNATLQNVTSLDTHVSALELVGVGSGDGLGDAILALCVVQTRPDRRVEKTSGLLSFPVVLSRRKSALQSPTLCLGGIAYDLGLHDLVVHQTRVVELLNQRQ